MLAFQVSYRGDEDRLLLFEPRKRASESGNESFDQVLIAGICPACGVQPQRSQ